MPPGRHGISVVVRSMGRASLDAALDSVAAQDWPEVEVLVVAASGPTHPPLPALAGPHPVRRVQADGPLRRSAAANAGLDAAAHPWIIFLDDDDLFLPGHLSRLGAALQAQVDAVAAYADVELGDVTPAGWQGRHVFGGDFDAMRLRFENFIPLNAALVDRSRGNARDCRFDPALDLFEDWDWWLQLASQGLFVHVAGVSARYVASPEGGSGVFADSPPTQAARHQLMRKWLLRDSDDDRLALLGRLQTEYRAARQCSAQLELAARTEADLRHIVGAREQERAQLQATLAARQKELSDALAQIGDLHELVAAREAEVANALAQIQDLRRVVVSREREIADAQVHASNLQQVLAARDAEIQRLRTAASRR